MSHTTVLVPCAGAGPAVAVIKALTRQREVPVVVVGADADPTAPGLYLCARGHLVPPVDDPAYVPALMDLCRRERVQAVLPVLDLDVETLARQRDVFARAGVAVLANPWRCVQTACDKLLAHRLCRRRGIPVPALYPPAALRRGAYRLPVVLKPRRGTGSRGVRVLESAEQVAHAPRGSGWLLQAYVPGDEYTVDALADPQGRPLAVVPRRRLQVRDGQTVKGQVVMDPAVVDFTRRVMRCFGVTGAACVQCKVCDGQIYLIELNPRFGTGVSLTVAAGVNLPLMQLRLHLGLPVDITALQPVDGMVMLRYWEEVTLPPQQVLTAAAGAAGAAPPGAGAQGPQEGGQGGLA